MSAVLNKYTEFLLSLSEKPGNNTEKYQETVNVCKESKGTTEKRAKKSVDSPGESMSKRAKGDQNREKSEDKDEVLVILSTEVSKLLRENAEGLSHKEISGFFPDVQQGILKEALVLAKSLEILGSFYHKENVYHFDSMAEDLLEILLKLMRDGGGHTSAPKKG